MAYAFRYVIGVLQQGWWDVVGWGWSLPAWLLLPWHKWHQTMLVFDCPCWPFL